MRFVVINIFFGGVESSIEHYKYSTNKTGKEFEEEIISKVNDYNLKQRKALNCDSLISYSVIDSYYVDIPKDTIHDINYPELSFKYNVHNCFFCGETYKGIDMIERKQKSIIPNTLWFCKKCVNTERII